MNRSLYFKSVDSSLSKALKIERDIAAVAAISFPYLDNPQKEITRQKERNLLFFVE
jgi:hypothetical protein